MLAVKTAVKLPKGKALKAVLLLVPSSAELFKTVHHEPSFALFFAYIYDSEATKRLLLFV